MRKKSYYCDCCKKQVKEENDLTWIEISLGASNGVTNKEVCFDCWKIYINKMAEISKEMFCIETIK